MLSSTIGKTVKATNKAVMDPLTKALRNAARVATAAGGAGTAIGIGSAINKKKKKNKNKKK